MPERSFAIEQWDDGPDAVVVLSGDLDLATVPRLELFFSLSMSRHYPEVLVGLPAPDTRYSKIRPAFRSKNVTSWCGECAT